MFPPPSRPDSTDCNTALPTLPEMAPSALVTPPGTSIMNDWCWGKDVVDIRMEDGGRGTCCCCCCCCNGCEWADAVVVAAAAGGGDDDGLALAVGWVGYDVVLLLV